MLKNRWIGLGLIAAMLAFSAAVFGQLPARVPIHWNSSCQHSSRPPRLRPQLTSGSCNWD